MTLRRFCVGIASGLTVGYGAYRWYETRAFARAPMRPHGGNAQAYGGGRRRFAVAANLRSVAQALAIAYGPLGEIIDRSTERLPLALRPAAFAALLGVLESIVDFPIALHEDYARERRYALTDQTPDAWMIDYAKGAALGVGVTAISATLIGAVVRRMPRAWPLAASIATLPLLILANVIVPIYILPLFNRFEPLTGPLELRLRALAARYGVGDADILRMDMSRQTKKANAFVIGIGKTHRIVLADTLIDAFTPDEIAFVVAHELGHYVMRDTWRMTGVAQAFATMLFIVARCATGKRESPEVLARPLLLARIYAAMTIGGQALRPLLLSFSRSREWAADHFALESTRDPRSGSAAFRRLREQNLAEFTEPGWYEFFFSSHPSLGARIAALDASAAT